MKRYFYQNNQIGFAKWCRNVPRIRNAVRQYRNSITSAQRVQFKDRYEEALISHKQYIKLIKTLTKEEQDFFHNYLVSNKVPPRKDYYHQMYDKIFFTWSILLFTPPREVERIDRVKLGEFLKQKRVDCQYSQDDVCAFVGINIISLRLIENGEMDIKATHLYSMLWLYGVELKTYY